jgi:1,4-dihydroxy-2-naphthoate octaprenyltransferase
MARGDWFRALQVPVLPVSAGAAIVGSLLGVAAGATLNGLVFALVLASLITIQIAANLQKGTVESSDLKVAPARPRSAFVFDAGAVGRTGIAPQAARRLTLGLFAAGAGLGLIVVLITGDLALLALGALGAFFAYSYSGPPLKLSYHGIGELATFVAFGPLMVWGAYQAQVGGDILLQFSTRSVLFMTWEAFWVGLAYGALAAMISFSRYFPAEAEDRAKGKRTPVVARGAQRAAAIFAALAATAAITLLLAWLHPTPDWCSPLLVTPPPARASVELLLAVALTGCVGAFAMEQFRKGDSAAIETAVARTVELHLVVTIVLSLGLVASLRCGSLF